MVERVELVITRDTSIADITAFMLLADRQHKRGQFKPIGVPHYRDLVRQARVGVVAHYTQEHQARVDRGDFLFIVDQQKTLGFTDVEMLEELLR